MFCCLHSSFLGELTLILLLLLFISETIQDFYILVLSLVFKETHYFILLEHPQKLKKKFGYQGLPIYGRVTAAAFMKS